MRKYLLLFMFTFVSALTAQLDTVKGIWPYPPFYQSHGINATFGEFRNTLSSDHFHNAVDIGEPDGNPCYPSLDGVVRSLVRTGSNAYIRIATKVGSKWKQLTYLHIVPAPSLSIGDNVKAGKTLIGKVVNGMGHVHLIERELASSVTALNVPINNLRKNGGLTPFVDTWAPKISSSSLKFYINNSNTKLSANELFGKVDIQVKIEEINGTGGGQTNNGTYIAGYRIWNEAKTEVVYEPDDNGVKYRFDAKPLDTYVHNVFVKNLATLSNPVYWLTNGNGANKINSSRVVSDNYFDASALPKGNYQLEIFAEDTRDNKTNKFFPISIADPKPKAPLVYEVLNYDSKRGVKIKWKSNEESDVVGYRLYYATDSELSDWQLAADEKQLTNAITEYSITSPTEYKVPATNPVYFYKLTAVDASGQESDASSLYAKSDFIDGTQLKKALIVNAFPKKNSKGEEESHSFVEAYYNGLSVADSLVISSISNRVFLDGIRGLALKDYDIVLWFAGDNTNHTATIQVKEMSNLAEYLTGGGNLLVSGSKIGYDLDERMGAFTDTLFYHNYLKAKYVYLGDTTMIPATGVANTLFDGITLRFGEVAEEKYPDDIDPIYGSEVLLNYSSTRKDGEVRHAAVGYKGAFGESSTAGAIIYVAFPLETVASVSEMEKFFKAMLQYFEVITNVKDESSSAPSKFSLAQNYPNPFNPSTIIKYTIPANVQGSRSNVKLIVYDVLGRKIAALVNKRQMAGSYSVKFDISGVNQIASGVYFYRLQAGNFVDVKKMILIK